MVSTFQFFKNIERTVLLYSPQIYKVEKHIHRCIESVLKQTYANWELILVDDGSPDSCGRICDAYAARYDNILVIHQENQGLSAARNAGLDRAGGELSLIHI